ncbi:MAG: hypothetical protein KDA37_08475, partial [Planctomycetales bacterium]|nr:hypothetical protein [Planctomycetales bacterium]
KGVGTVAKVGRPPSFAQQLQERLTLIEDQLVAVVESSSIHNIDPNRYDSAAIFIGFVEWDWGPSDPALEASRMSALRELTEVEPLVRLLFPHPVGRVEKQLNGTFKLLRGWMTRKKPSHSVPSSIDVAVAKVRSEMAAVRGLVEQLPADSHPVRLAVDTNALIDCPDLSIYTGGLGPRYRAHLMPVVLGELDDLKRSGRTPELREAAAKAVKRLKGLRANGDPRAGVRVAGDVSAVFEHIEPASGDLPGWLDLTVPDDRFIASALLLQCAHPGSAVYAATGDINLQNKLSAVGIPFIEPPNP